MNQCNFLGRFTADPEKKEFSWGYLITFSLAVSRNYKTKAGDQIVDFFRFKSSRPNTSNYIEQFIKKGDLVYIIASAENTSFEDKEGKKVNYVEFSVERIKLVQSRHNELKDQEAYIKSPEDYKEKRVPKVLQEKINNFANRGVKDLENAPF